MYLLPLQNFSIAKRIVSIDPPPVNVNLNSSVYILFGRRVTSSAEDYLLPHEDFPQISTKKYDPVKDKTKGEGDNFPKLPLVRAHGTLMLIAWPLFGVCGVFFASWMRPALPKGQWFQVSDQQHESSFPMYILVPSLGTPHTWSIIGTQANLVPTRKRFVCTTAKSLTH